MEIIAKARYVRMAPRKLRLLAGLIRGLDIAPAEAQLGFSPKAAARPVLKLLRSAVANAEHNFKLERETLYIKKITVDGGPVLKRWRSRAFGRAAPIRKRTAHIVIVLSERAEGAAAKGKKTKGKAAKTAAGLKAALVKTAAAAKKATKKETKEKPDEPKAEAAGKPAAKDKSQTKKSKE